MLKETRITLEKIYSSDAEFILKLYNSASYLKYIGDRNLKTIADAEQYIAEKFTATYQKKLKGIGYYKVMYQNKAIGTCGIVHRDELSYPDLGFALLPEFENQGFGFEAAKILITYVKAHQIFNDICAITLPNNENCIRLLQKLGFIFSEKILFTGDSEILNLYQLNLK